MSNRTDLQTELDLAKAGIAALHAEKRALLEWLDATAVSWELAEGREEHVTGVAWRAAHDGVLDGDHLGGMTSSELEAQAKKEGMLTMIEDGIFKCVQGLTTIEEVLRVVSE